MFYFDNFKSRKKHNVGLENILMAYSLCKNHNVLLLTDILLWCDPSVIIF